MLFILIMIFGLFLAVFFYVNVYFLYPQQIYSLENVPPNKTVLVLGAGLEKNGMPSDILRDRLISTVALISRTSPACIVLSGAKSLHSASEPYAMAAFLKNDQIDSTILSIDEQGTSTFHSLINLLHTSPVQPITIISQRFHLTRALFISRILGLQCVGLAADNLTFAKWKVAYWYIREILATPFNIGKIICYKIFHCKRKS